MLKYPPHVSGDLNVFRIKTWMMIELYIFYSLSLTATFFLAFIQIRGFVGKKRVDENRNRYKFDAIDYYEIDIEWLSF